MCFCPCTFASQQFTLLGTKLLHYRQQKRNWKVRSHIAPSISRTSSHSYPTPCTLTHTPTPSHPLHPHPPLHPPTPYTLTPTPYTLTPTPSSTPTPSHPYTLTPTPSLPPPTPSLPHPHPPLHPPTPIPSLLHPHSHPLHLHSHPYTLQPPTPSLPPPTPSPPLTGRRRWKLQRSFSAASSPDSSKVFRGRAGQPLHK